MTICPLWAFLLSQPLLVPSKPLPPMRDYERDYEYDYERDYEYDYEHDYEYDYEHDYE